MGFLMDFFYSSTEIHCSLPVWYWWLMLSDFESYSGCFLLKAESVTLSCQIYIYILYVVNMTVHMNLFSIVKYPHCRQLHSTVRTFFQGLQHCLRKIGGCTEKLGIQWGPGYAYSMYQEVARSFPEESSFEFNIFSEWNTLTIFIENISAFHKRMTRFMSVWVNLRGFQSAFLKRYTEAVALRKLLHVNYSGLPAVQISWLLILPDVRRMGNRLITEFMLARETDNPAVQNLWCPWDRAAQIDGPANF